MGLLSDPEYGSVKWVRILKKVHKPLCFFLYIGAIAWFIMLGNKDFNNETYFSENALLPGLVTNEFNGEQSASKFYTEFLEELEDKYDDTAEMPVPWLVAKMSQLHLEVYTHNYTLNYPMGQGQIYKGTNVYGILRAPRTASLEALVISAPYRPLNSHQKGTAAGIALMLAFAQFARPQNYWAKDLIFLITEHEQLGMQAWLEAYHGITSDAETFYTSLGSFWKHGQLSLDINKLMPGFEWSEDHEKCLNPGKLRGRSGSIQAALNLEFHTPKIKYIEVKVEGLNGQLPNLDLFNLVHKLCVKSGIHHSYRNSYSWIRSRNKMEDWANNLWTMAGMVGTQFSGVPNGNHGLFHRFGIEAVTLEGRDASDPSGTPPRVNALNSANFYRLGIALESILRSLNNLLERFHQSFFFYLLAGTNRFVSIGQYMPSLCVLCLAMLIRALALWVSIQPNETNKNKDTSIIQRKTSDPDILRNNKEEENTTVIPKSDEEITSTKESPNKEKASKEEKETKNKKFKKSEETSMSIVTIGTNYLLVHLLGYVVMNLPVFFTYMGTKYDVNSEVAVFNGLAAFSLLLVLTTPFLPRLFRKTPITYEELSLVNILLLVELSTVCLSVGMHNFSLGLIMAVVYTPLALLLTIVEKGKGINCFLQIKKLICLLLHPLSVLTISMVAYSCILFPDESILEKVGRGRDAATQALMFSIVDSFIYGNWLFSVGCSAVLPMWIVFWQILNNKVQPYN